MMKEERKPEDDSSDMENSDLNSIVKKIIELLMALLGLKMGAGGRPPTSEEAANHISQEDWGKRLAENSENLSKLEGFLKYVPGATSMAARMAADQLKPYLDNPEVQSALQGQLGDSPGGDKIRSELAKYPNICKFIDKVAKNTESKELALATQSPAAQAKTKADETSSFSMSSLPNTTGNSGKRIGIQQDIPDSAAT